MFKDYKKAIHRISKWCKRVIDHEKVKKDGKDWIDVFDRQKRVPGYVLALATIFGYVLHQSGELTLWYFPVAALFVAYSFLPAIGAYHYMIEEGENA